MRLNWIDLFSAKRVRASKNEETNNVQIRNAFDRDYERIIYSSSVRRLQDKAQVFPLQENDFTRTRLTHSLEVASLGRSMAWQISEKIMKGTDKQITQEDKEQFADYAKMKRLPSIVETACLVHDLGNPPFGHYGEDIIKNWFTKFFSKYSGKELKLSEEEKADFCSYDGNAQNIHILTKLQFLNDQYGVNFTFATLATLMKYPWASSECSIHDKKDKFGYMQSETTIFESIKAETGIGPHRHPATYIVEAADDIAYLTADIEDAVKKGLLSWAQFSAKFENKDKSETDILSILEELIEIKKFSSESYGTFKENVKLAKKNNVPELDLILFQNFKVMVQGIMIQSAIQAFMDNYGKIMEGEVEPGKSLLDLAEIALLTDMLEATAIKYCFQAEEVVSLELVGDRVITDLLDLFVPAMIELDNCTSAKKKNEKLVKLISRNFIFVKNLEFNEKDMTKFTDYQKLQIVVDFISGMTDSYAVNLHKRLSNGKL